MEWKKEISLRDKTKKLNIFTTLEITAIYPTKLSKVQKLKSKSGTNINMVLQTYGLSISEDESIENRLVDDSDVIISDRKGVNYIDNMLAMSPFAGDYPPAANYINYTDLDASYPTQGKFFLPPSLIHEKKTIHFRSDASQMMLNGST